MWADAVTGLLVVALSIGYIICNRILKKNGKKFPPYAPGGMLTHVQMFTSSGYPWWILDVARQLQTRVFQIRLPNRPTSRSFVVGEPALFREILNDKLTTKPLRVYSHFALTNGEGIDSMLTMNGSGWHSKRKAIAPAFSSKSVRRMNQMAIEKTEEWIQDTLTEKESFDVSREMLGIVLTAVTETAFEYSMSQSEQDYFSEQLEIVLIEFTLKSPSNPLRTVFGLLIPERRRAYVAAQNVMQLALKIMNEYTKKAPSDNGNKTVIQLIMESEAHPTEKEKAAEIITFLIAGHDTTAFSIAWILLELAKNPDEQKKLRQSLSEFSPENWGHSGYLKMVVNEGMRLHPVLSSGGIRVIGRDMITKDNKLLPKGSVTFLPHMLIMRNPDVYDKPDAFEPSRWDKPSRAMLDAFVPFSMGKQNCIGQSLAKAETYAIVARICSEFELAVEEEGSVDFFLTLKPIGWKLSARKL